MSLLEVANRFHIFGHTHTNAMAKIQIVWMEVIKFNFPFLLFHTEIANVLHFIAFAS